MFKYFVKKWILLKMSAEEFYFKNPFDIEEEYTTMKTLVFFGLVPIELIAIFTYARIFGSLRRYTWPLIVLAALVNLLICNVVINAIKGRQFILDTMSEYHRLDVPARKKLYSFKNSIYVIFLMLLPWWFFWIALPLICFLVPGRA